MVRMLYNPRRMPRIVLLLLVLALAPLVPLANAFRQPPAQAPAATAPPDTEIFLASFSVGGTPVVGPGRNITNSPGYDNQPSFTPDGRGILFTSIRGGGTQTDIYRYDVASGAIARVTDTPESEYSATVTPDGAHISVIRVEADVDAAAVAIHARRPAARAGARRREAGRLSRVGRRSHARAVRARPAGDAAACRYADGEGRHHRARHRAIASADSRGRLGTISFVERVRRVPGTAGRCCQFASSIRRRDASRRSWRPSPARAKPTARGRRTACW